ncbi:hypothetical protein AX17_000124 [Amanita inopinata Kibby_2008]|nr:hypothetical protein AX17_000124 [Amanita inopinata Kibby_2008]
MSRWNVEDGDVSGEVQTLRNKLSSQDARLAAQQTQIMRQTQEINEMKLSLNDAIHKLNFEAQRALQLENDLQQRTNDYQNQRLSSQNAELALVTAHDAIKAKELEAKEIHSILDTVSRASDEHRMHVEKLKCEKGTLEMRVRELEAEARKAPLETPGTSHRTTLRSRSSSTSEKRVSILERELEDTRLTLSQTEVNLKSLSQKLSHAHSELIRAGNEKVALGKRMSSQITELTASLEENEEELRLIKRQMGDTSREEELLKRIEEDEAKISALESMLRGSCDVQDLRDQLKVIEEKLSEEKKKVVETEERCIDLVREKEGALDELEVAKAEVHRLSEVANQCNALIEGSGLRNPREDCQPGTSLNGSDLGQAAALSPMPPNETMVSYIERLLAAVTRLRAERDSLLRDLQFLESESKFTIEALETKLSSVKSDNSHVKIQGLQAESNIALSKDIIKRSSQAAIANAVLVSHLDSRVSELQNHQLLHDSKYMDLQAQLREKEITVVQQAEKVRQLELDVLAISGQKDDLDSHIAHRETQWEDERQRLLKYNQDTRSCLEALEGQISDLSRALENAESERDSLSLQVTNLTSELQSTQKELSDAETRYSSLQFHQLSTLSTNEANRVLRDQLKEMEMRVARRTEQIGIHQHDIRRLETNLRLQEERLCEMTADLETLAAQKDAMVEDCADAREARDTALARVETLEMELETSEGKLEQSDTTLVSLVAVVTQVIGDGRESMKKMRERQRIMDCQVQAVHSDRQDLLKLCDDNKRSLANLQSSLEDSNSSVRQMGFALAMSRLQVGKTSLALQASQNEKNLLDTQVRDLSAQIGQYNIHTASVTAELEACRDTAAEHVARITRLENQILELQDEVTKKTNRYQTLADELADYKEKLRSSLHEKETQLVDKNATEISLADLRSRHADELTSLQQELDAATLALNQMRTLLTSAEEDKQRLASESARTQRNLEERIETISMDAAQSSQAKDELLRMQAEYQEELSQLSSKLDAATRKNEGTQKLLRDLEESHQRTLNEFAAVRQTYEAELARANEHEISDKGQREKDLAGLRLEFDRQTRELEESAREVQIIETQRHAAETALEELKGEVINVTEELRRSREELGQVQNERISLQENMTHLEGEVQRSLSMTRFLESQVKESEHIIVSLNSECDKLRADLARLDTSRKTAEVNLSLQSAQHKREIAELQRELDALQSKPDLAAAVLELEERNNDMEDLLRRKCAEIEENDDQILEILKDNKKLTTKVESLNRKVQNLQAKLSAAKASIPKVTSDTGVVAPPSPPAVSVPNTQPRPTASTNALDAISKPGTASNAVTTRGQAVRNVSVGPSVPRPKTPERHLAHPTVFRAKTPERRISSATNSGLEEAGQVIGKKRRAPDDFEVCEGLPPQGFTVDSVPEDARNENRTPRVRRMLSGGLSGFTPVRRSNAVQSPQKRVSTTSTKAPALIADVTNSPRAVSGKNSKRSWLGKIRGTASQTTAKIVGSRSVSERAEERS